jgi:2'-5' RNA ligase
VSARLFLAVEVGEEDRGALAGWAAAEVGEDRGMRLTDPAQIHLTIAFLGHRALEEIAPLEALAARWEGTAAPELRTAGALWLSPRRPHVLTVAVRDVSGALAALHDEVWTALEELGLRREARAYRPHLTVARVRHGWSAPSARLSAAPDRALEARGLVLFRSWIGGGPARHEALARARFRALS